MRTEHFNLPASKLPLVEGEEVKKGDWRHSFHWRVFRIIAEFTDGWQFLADFRKTVTFFGSARCRPGDRWYDEAQKLGELLANDGFHIVTGGGPGIMEAGNHGAYDAYEKAPAGKKNKIGDSIGLNIKLPFEQRINRFVRKAVAFHYFFVRKVMLSYYAQAYVYFPGGFGTLDEAFELITLAQVKKIPPLPIILIGKDYWQPLVEWIKTIVLEKFAAIDAEDLNLFTVVDSAEAAHAIIKHSKERKEF